jgi:hypothetical protein
MFTRQRRNPVSRSRGSSQCQHTECYRTAFPQLQEMFVHARISDHGAVEIYAVFQAHAGKSRFEASGAWVCT